MNIFSKIFRKRHSPNPAEAGNSSEKLFQIVIDSTSYDLSEEERKIIVSIIRNGLNSNTNLEDIAIDIMVSINIYGPILISFIDNGIEVIIC